MGFVAAERNKQGQPTPVALAGPPTPASRSPLKQQLAGRSYAAQVKLTDPNQSEAGAGSSDPATLAQMQARIVELEYQRKQLELEVKNAKDALAGLEAPDEIAAQHEKIEKLQWQIKEILKQIESIKQAMAAAGG